MKRRTWTAAKKARVLRYYQSHGHTATAGKYEISGGMLSRWAKELLDRPLGSAAPHVSKANGSVKDAIIYLQHAEGALKGKPSNAELFALLALRTLTGEIAK